MTTASTTSHAAWLTCAQEPRATTPGTAWQDLVTAWRTAPATVFACQYRGRLFLLDRADELRVAPSPATLLARHEVPALLERVEVRHALTSPAERIEECATLSELLERFERNGWLPLLVGSMEAPRVVTPRALLAWMVSRCDP